MQKLIQMEANIDDMSPEYLAHAQQVLLDEGALDAWQESIVMKKGRLATKLCALVEPGQRDRVVAAYFRETTTCGVREWSVQRTSAERKMEVLEVEGMPIRIKTSRYENIEVNSKVEYEDCLCLAKKLNVSRKEALKLIEDSWKRKRE